VFDYNYELSAAKKLKILLELQIKNLIMLNVVLIEQMTYLYFHKYFFKNSCSGL